MLSGIPRFFEEKAYYWGEVDRQRADTMLRDARTTSWVEAAKKHLQPHLWDYLFDTERAAWLPLVGLESDSVALDIGSGYGGITHALSNSAQTVYSLEAVPERVEFTQIRLQQSQVSNVVLVQGSALELPFAPKSFDLIVVNGVLEWIGDWDRRSDPRAAQLRFLSNVRELLKESGVLLVGIENRFGYNLFQGGIDHSNMRYTSLMPRWAASLVMRKRKIVEHKLTVHSKLEYRTYTYSARGYRKLLREAGFPKMNGYWVDPGYNHPRNLISLKDSKSMSSHYRTIFSSRPGWKQRLKRWAADRGFFNGVVPTFVFTATRNSSRESQVQRWFAQQLQTRSGEKSSVTAGDIEFSAKKGDYRPKSTLHFVVPAFAGKEFVAKSEYGRNAIKGMVASEYALHVAAYNQMMSKGSGRISIPEPVGSLGLQNAFLSIERIASGIPLADYVSQPNYFHSLSQVKAHFSEVFSVCKECFEVLQGLSCPKVDPAWFRIPQELGHDSVLVSTLEQMRSEVGQLRTWTQHGDFTMENIFLNGSDKVSVIDWAHLASGLPPLYDAFSFLSSVYFLSDSKTDISAMSEEEWRSQSFLDTFVNDNKTSRFFAECMADLCQHAGLSRDDLPAFLIDYLIVRANFFVFKSDRQAAISRKLLRLAAANGQAKILGVPRRKAISGAKAMSLPGR